MNAVAIRVPISISSVWSAAFLAFLCLTWFHWGQGDLYVKVQVVTPDSLNDEQREALEAFAEAGGEDIDVEQGFFEKLRQSF